MEDDPKVESIAAWPHELLVKFAKECYAQNKTLREYNEQLRLDNKMLLTELRKHVDDWK